MDQLSHPYLTSGRTIVLSIGTLVGIVMPFLFNTFWFYHNFPCKEQACFNILAAVSFRGDYSNELFLRAAPAPLYPLRPEARPRTPRSPSSHSRCPHASSASLNAPPPGRPGSAESPPPGRSALSLRVSADSCKPGSGARQVEVSQLSVSFSV